MAGPYQPACPLRTWLALAWFALCLPLAAHGATVVAIEARTAIGVASAMALEAGLERARKEGATLVVLKLDTPGGLVSATREMIQSILASPIPVAVYVAPSGARAASAGTYLAYAAHVAAMAPGTSIGAATPVQMGIGPESPPDEAAKEDGKAEPRGSRRERKGSAMERKVLNDAVAFIRGLAQLRGRNADWAEKAVREAETLTAPEAVEARVVDLMADDVADLLAKVHGRTVKLGGVERTLDTRDAAVIELRPNWRMRLIAAVTDPNVAFILLLVGVYGLILEFATPGLTAPGVLGAIALLVALAALSMLPVSMAGAALLLLGIVLIAAEAFTPGFGLLGIGGLAAFVAGGVFLFDPDGADIDFRVAVPVLVGAAITTAGLVLGVLGLAVRARGQTVATGDAQLRRERAEVLRWAGLAGTVRVHGEVWTARSLTPHAPGDSVEIVERDGLTLVVR